MSGSMRAYTWHRSRICRARPQPYLVSALSCPLSAPFVCVHLAEDVFGKALAEGDKLGAAHGELDRARQDARVVAAGLHGNLLRRGRRCRSRALRDGLAVRPVVPDRCLWSIRGHAYGCACMRQRSPAGRRPIGTYHELRGGELHVAVGRVDSGPHRLRLAARICTQRKRWPSAGPTDQL